MKPVADDGGRMGPFDQTGDEGIEGVVRVVSKKSKKMRMEMREKE